MPTLTDFLFHSLLFLKKILFFNLFFPSIRSSSIETFLNSHLLYEPLPPLLDMIFTTRHALLGQNSREIHALLSHALLVSNSLGA
jgi:hypothetical protein